MIQACLWSSLFYSMSYPFIHLYLMRNITEKMVSLNQIAICVFIIVVNNIWNKYSDKLYKYYKHILATEGILYLILHLGMVFNKLSPIYYYAIDTFLFCMVTKNIMCGGNKLRSKAYKDENREKYDNTVQIVAAVATLCGASIAIALDIKIQVAFILSWIGIAVDNVFYWMAYDKYA